MTTHGHLHAAAQQVRGQQPRRAEPTEQTLRNRRHTRPACNSRVFAAPARGRAVAVAVAAQAQVTWAAGSLSQRKCMQLRMAGSDASSASCSKFTSVLRAACVWGVSQERATRRTSRTHCSSCRQCQPCAPRSPPPPASAAPLRHLTARDCTPCVTGHGDIRFNITCHTSHITHHTIKHAPAYHNSAERQLSPCQQAAQHTGIPAAPSDKRCRPV